MSGRDLTAISDRQPATRESAEAELQAMQQEAVDAKKVRRRRRWAWIGKWLKRFSWKVAAVGGGLYVIVMSAAPIEWSREFLPEPLHLLVLLVYALVLGCLLSWVGTERGRKKNHRRIVDWFGPNGLLLLPFLVLVVSAYVLASFTATLVDRRWVALEPAGASAVTEGTLVDFYIWHFLELVPLIDVNEILKWERPLAYSQSRVGFLILLFQALVVIPSIRAIRSYWKDRHPATDDQAGPDLEQRTLASRASG